MRQTRDNPALLRCPAPPSGNAEAKPHDYPPEIPRSILRFPSLGGRTPPDYMARCSRTG
ncbi:hypothetical protein CBM2598_U10300 [Cupriavidus taiwanensis]|nr:hypothetical protein CBM2598_U10300 [Cupriavidus taiwanensis]